MKKLSHWICKNRTYPSSVGEWSSIYSGNIINFLCRCGALKYGSKYDLADEIFCGSLYRINLLGENYRGFCEDNGDVKEFSEEELRRLYFSEKAFARCASTSIGLEKSQTSKFIYGGNGYCLGEIKSGKVNYVVFLCYDSLNFEREISHFSTQGEKSIPIVYTFDEEFITGEIGDLVYESGGHIVPISEAFELLETKLKCLKSPSEIVGCKDSKKTVQKFSCSDVWLGKIPKNASWKDIKIKLRLVDNWLEITYKGESKEIYFKNISFFKKPNDDESKYWTLFKKVLTNNATSKDDTTKRYMTELNRLLASFFKLPPKPLAITGNRTSRKYTPSFEYELDAGNNDNPRQVRKQVFKFDHERVCSDETEGSSDPFFQY